MRWVLHVVLPCVLAAGCSDGKSSSPCYLATSGDGDATWSFDGDPACLIPFGGTVGIDMFFAPLTGDVKHVIVRIADVREGETGTFPATANVELRAGGEFESSQCAVVITEHAATGESDMLSRTFQTAGEGSCADAAIEMDGPRVVTIEPFEFRFPARW